MIKVFTSERLKSKHSRINIAETTTDITSKDKRFPKGDKSACFSANPTRHAGTIKRQVEIKNLRYLGFFLQFLCIKTKFNMVDKAYTKESPTKSAYIPINAGKKKAEASINTPLMIKQTSVLCSNPIEFSMLVVTVDRLINGIRKEKADRYFPHS